MGSRVYESCSGRKDASEGSHSTRVNANPLGDEDATNHILSRDTTAEQVVIPEFSGIVVPVIATVLVLFSVRARDRLRGRF